MKDATAHPSQYRGRNHSGDNPGENVKSISNKFYLRELAFEWELTEETIYLPLGCFQGGYPESRLSPYSHLK